MRPVNRGAAPAQLTISGRPSPNYTELYNYFMAALIGRLGEYCSYCEVPLAASLAIEHILPKSVFVDADTDWTNFLLACTNCNSTKNVKVVTREACFFPDQDATMAKFEYYLDVNGLALVRPYAALSGTEQQKATTLIGLVGLNAYDASSAKDSNRRVRNRTVAWNRAAGMAQKLAVLYAPYSANQGGIAADPFIALFKQQIMATALATGFWSVWMTVFGNAAYDFLSASIRSQLLCDLFVTPFPGTRFAIAGTTCA